MITWRQARDFLNTLEEDQLEDAVSVYDAESGNFFMDCDLMDQVEDDIISADRLFISCSMGSQK